MSYVHKKVEGVTGHIYKIESELNGIYWVSSYLNDVFGWKTINLHSLYEARMMLACVSCTAKLVRK